MMANSHREIIHFVAANMMLYIGVVVGLNCDSTSVPSAVPFCSNMRVSGRPVYLSGIDNKTNGIGCNCSISLTQYKQEPVYIEIKNVTTTSRCDYLLHYVYENTSHILYSCVHNLNVQRFSLKSMETVRLHMEKGTDNGDGFPFCLEFLSEIGVGIRLQCSTTSTTTTVSTTPLTHTNTPISSNGISTISTTSHSPTSSTSGNDDTSFALSTTLTSSTGTYEGVRGTTLVSKSSDMTRSATESQPANDDSDRLIGIIVGSIVGVLIVVALVILIVRLVKRRQKKLPYETPLEPQDRPHIYLNTVVTPNNNSQIMNPGNQGMIYLENDLYKSIDDDVPVGRRGGNHEGMIYLENDLYISSNVTDDVNQDAENSVPHQPVEYAVVNKTAKKSSSSNGASMGHTLGPGGDEYTVVLKK